MHSFIESIKMLNITEPHDQLLQLTFLFRMLSSLYMDLTPAPVTLQHAIMLRFIFRSQKLITAISDSLIGRVLTPISKRRGFSVSFAYVREVLRLFHPRISSTLIL